MSKHAPSSNVIVSIKSRDHAAGTGTQLVIKFEGEDKERSCNVYKGSTKEFPLMTDCQVILGKPSKNQNPWSVGTEVPEWITSKVLATKGPDGTCFVIADAEPEFNEQEALAAA